MGKDLSGRRVRAIAPDDRVAHSYFLFADGQLLRAGTGSTHAEVIAEAADIGEVGHSTGDGRLKGKELEIRLYVHGPWVCVTERFGLNATLINTTTGRARGFCRADYHSDVSSYSIGFLDWDGRTLLLAQTQWNRLDVFDAETGENLTEREVFIRDSGRLNEQGHKVYDRRNYIDYFHSLLHVSPDSRHFLSNGWVWSPVDMVRVFSTEAFLTGYEPTSIPVGTAFGYNWDRPCAFIDDRTFVLALDDSVDALDEDEAASYEYRQLAFFEIPQLPLASDANRWLEPSFFVDCDVFPRNQYGEVKGELHYDPESACLVALTDGNGSLVLSLNGRVVAHAPDVSLASPPSHTDFGSSYSEPLGWSYAPKHRTFYRWLDGAGIEERALPTASS
ncbi:hypothetical protein [Rugosimonospora africana]|uniref:Uncharacterized protein n=1 Tax=Rugosimonospora africana TaxID=556532 RepID=A0A8J3QXU1_9ACTN|nr:hypothetical protein [Rugosimonospora africana]GIH16656.1 hypothetical protein Raf01_48280 [Rugosimonospora africana]